MKRLTIFGGDDGWQNSDWTASDDRVRGGKSQSHLCCADGVARFYGNLDIDTLGGAGFASQRTASDDLALDLSEYAGISLCIEEGDDKRYTFILKNDLQPPDEESGREQSSISWECDFELPTEDVAARSTDESIFIPWDSFTPTYRGKPVEDADPLDLQNIQRISIMIRSFFGVQQGDFSITLKSISALCEAPPPIIYQPGPTKIEDVRRLEEGTSPSEHDQTFGGIRSNLGLLINGHRKSAYAIIIAVALATLYFRYR